MLLKLLWLHQGNFLLGSRPRLFAEAGAAEMGVTRGLFAEPSALAF
jgi:hypothetical protein